MLPVCAVEKRTATYATLGQRASNWGGSLCRTMSSMRLSSLFERSLRMRSSLVAWCFTAWVSGGYLVDPRGLLLGVFADQRVLQVVLEHALVFERAVVDEVAAVEVFVGRFRVHPAGVDRLEAVRGEVLEEHLEGGVRVQVALVEAVLGPDGEQQHDVRVGHHLVVEADPLVVGETQVRERYFELQVDVRVHAFSADGAAQVLDRVLEPARPVVRGVQSARHRVDHVRASPILEQVLDCTLPFFRLELADLPQHVRHLEQEEAVEPRRRFRAQLLDALHERRVALRVCSTQLAAQLALLLGVEADGLFQALLGCPEVHLRDHYRVRLLCFEAAELTGQQTVLSLQCADRTALLLAHGLLCLGQLDLRGFQRVVVVAPVLVVLVVLAFSHQRDAGDCQDGLLQVLVELLPRHKLIRFAFLHIDERPGPTISQLQVRDCNEDTSKSGTSASQ